MEYDYSCCYYCPHLHKNRERSLLLFCLVSCVFFVMAALKIRIAVWWGMIPCSASAVVSVSLGCRFREESRRAVTKQGFLPILPVLGLSDSRAELLNMDMVNDRSFKGMLPGSHLDKTRTSEKKKNPVVCVGWRLKRRSGFYWDFSEKQEQFQLLPSAGFPCRSSKGGLGGAAQRFS